MIATNLCIWLKVSYKYWKTVTHAHTMYMYDLHENINFKLINILTFYNSSLNSDQDLLSGTHPLFL